MLFRHLPLLALGTFLSSVPGNVIACKSGPVAYTKFGPVEGITGGVPGIDGEIHKYLGIPFALSPPERFSPPVDPKRWEQPLQATAYKPACIQQFSYPEPGRSESQFIFNNPGGLPPPESEDCLYINVFTSGGEHSGPGKAVMVWVFGGGLNFGSGGIERYNGTKFAGLQDVVLVTFNYRTNVFGFSNSPEVPFGEQNSGFLDQRKALAWVHENIEAFGGDPEKVTIFGESAGGYSVKQLVSLPQKPLPFRAAILESEATVPGPGVSSWDSLVSAVDCTSAKSQIDCVREVPAVTIQNIIEHAALAFGPVYDNVTCMRDVRTAFEDHTAAPIPLFLGTNSQEGRVVAYLAQLDGPLPPGTIQAYLNSSFPGDEELQNAILEAYPLSLQNSPYEFISQVITDLLFTCTTTQLANVAAANGHHVWRYYFNASFPNTAFFPDSGVYHFSEVPEVFGTYPEENATAQEKALSEYMQTIWADFAKHPAAGAPWPKIGSNKGVELGLLGNHGNAVTSGEHTIALTKVDYACPVYDPIIVP